MADYDTDPIGLSGDELILHEARRDFKYCAAHFSEAYKNSLDDTKFANADPRNNAQWPDAIYDTRTGQDGGERPCLTINKTRTHNDICINEAMRNKSSIRIRPTGGEATYVGAQAMQSLVRRIENVSKATIAYRKAITDQVDGGFGWIFLETGWCSERSFDQEIYIRGCRDPRGVYLDPDGAADGLDADYGFVFNRMRRTKFNKQYPAWRDAVGKNTALGFDEAWLTDTEVQVADYYRREGTADTFIRYTDANSGAVVEAMESELRRDAGGELVEQLLADIESGVIDGKTRKVKNKAVKWYRIAGDTIIERGDWAGRYVPIIPCWGRCVLIEGKLDIKGHTRGMIDPQRMLNYNAPLSLDTRLPTPAGWTTMREVRAGDWVLDEHGAPVQVAGTSPIFLRRQCYEVEFDDGHTIVADAQHLWSVEERGKRKAAGTDWRQRTIPTEKLEPKKHFIYSASLDLPKAELPIHPYVLGVWLGDGSSAAGRLHFSMTDADEMRANVMACGYDVAAPSLYRGKDAAEMTVYGLKEQLAALGVLNNKHIPAAYLRASREQRQLLLRGLMDTDGCINPKNRQCIFTVGIAALAAGFAELIRTLGIRFGVENIRGKAAVYPNGKTYVRQDYLRISFSADPSQAVFWLNRKASIQKASRKTHRRRTARHKIVAIREVPSVPVKCIGVQSESHLFLAGDGMVPTHNSAFIEYGALQTKAPYVAPARAIEGQEQWKDANVKNYSVMTYNDIDEDANSAELQRIERPQREPPPQSAPVYADGMMSAERWMMMVSGQYQAQMGENDQQSAASGRAISERQRQGDTATWHFNEGQSDMFRAVGTQLIDLIPKIYDTERRLHVFGEDNSKQWLLIRPDNPGAIAELQKEKDEAAVLEFNPSIGEYEVAEPGPNYATERQEAWDALSQLMQQNIQLAAIMGDLYFKYGDFTGADELADRMKKEIQATKPYLFGDEAAPGTVQMQQQLQKLQQLNGELIQKLAEMQLKMRGREELRDIEASRADTDRMKVTLEFLSKALLSPAQRAQMQHELLTMSHQHVYDTIAQTNAADLAQQNAQQNSANGTDAA